MSGFRAQPPATTTASACAANARRTRPARHTHDAQRATRWIPRHAPLMPFRKTGAQHLWKKNLHLRKTNCTCGAPAETATAQSVSATARVGFGTARSVSATARSVSGNRTVGCDTARSVAETARSVEETAWSVMETAQSVGETAHGPQNGFFECFFDFFAEFADFLESSKFLKIMDC